MTPSPTEPNLASAAEAARAVVTAFSALAAGGPRFGRAVLLIPDRAVHAGLGSSGGSGRLSRLRTELIAALTAGTAADSAALDGRFRFGSLPGGPRRQRFVLGAVSAAAVVQQYESAVEAAGATVVWVDAVSLAVLPGWLAGSSRSEPRALLLLHRRHFALAAADGARIIGFRLRLRAALDPEPPVLAARRLARSGTTRSFAVRGDGAALVAEGLRTAGLPVSEVQPSPSSAAGRAALSPVLDGALSELLARAGGRPAPLARAPVPLPGGSAGARPANAPAAIDTAA